jgi:hypothetical protein
MRVGKGAAAGQDKADIGAVGIVIIAGQSGTGRAQARGESGQKRFHERLP